jgi:hypothetical protein
VPKPHRCTYWFLSYFSCKYSAKASAKRSANAFTIINYNHLKSLSNSAAIHQHQETGSYTKSTHIVSFKSFGAIRVDKSDNLALLSFGLTVLKLETPALKQLHPSGAGELTPISSSLNLIRWKNIDSF